MNCLSGDEEMLRKREIPIDIAFNAACKENDIEFKKLPNNREINKITFVDDEGNKCFFAKNVKEEPVRDPIKYADGSENNGLKAQELLGDACFAEDNLISIPTANFIKESAKTGLVYVSGNHFLKGLRLKWAEKS